MARNLREERVALMIPVIPQDEPGDFQRKVRDPGLRWLRDQGIAMDQPAPDPSALPTYWRETQKALWDAYDGVCAYLCIYFDWPLGAQSTDHFVAKSSNAGQAYEWLNYRLSCLGMNRAKNRFDDVLDPFEIEPDTFVLNLASGEISANPGLPPEVQQAVMDTIRRLKLDSVECNRMRADRYGEYCSRDVSERHLRKESPFVWHEAQRQGLL